MDMKTLLLPTTLGVNNRITLEQAVGILESNGVSFEVAGEVVNGMYVSEDGEIVREQLLPINSNISAHDLALMFTQECILESNGCTAKLVGQDGGVWASFKDKVEHTAHSIKEAVELQMKLAKRFGGASRKGTYVWAWS